MATATRIAKRADRERAVILQRQIRDGVDWLSLPDVDELTRVDRLTRQEKQGAFLQTLAETYSVTAACDAAGVSRQGAHKWRDADERFAALWDIAILRCKDQLEQASFQAALDGSTLDRFFLLKKLDNSYRDNHRPEPPGHATRQQVDADDSVSAWREAVIALGLGDFLPDVPALPETAGDAT